MYRTGVLLFNNYEVDLPLISLYNLLIKKQEVESIGQLKI